MALARWLKIFEVFKKSLILLLPLLFINVHAETLRVAVAANFGEVAKRLAIEFEEQTGTRVSISTGSSGALYAQIVQGAPFDVFLSADSQRPEELENSGLIIEQSRVTYAVGQLALWSVFIDKNNASMEINDYKEVLLKSRRIAIANPKTAPYGNAAEQFLNALDFSNEASAQVITGNNVVQAYQFKQTGNVDTAIVAYHLVMNNPNSILISSDYYSSLEQQLVIIKSTTKVEQARRFVDFLLSEQTQQRLEELGYARVAP